MKLIEDQTRVNGNDCIKFVPKTTEASFIRIMNNLGGCWSYVGRESQHSNTQPVSIDVSGANCAYTGIVAHELIHALGKIIEKWVQAKSLIDILIFLSKRLLA